MEITVISATKVELYIGRIDVTLNKTVKNVKYDNFCDEEVKYFLKTNPATIEPIKFDPLTEKKTLTIHRFLHKLNIFQN